MPFISKGFLWLPCWEGTVGDRQEAGKPFKRFLCHAEEVMVARTIVLQCE